MAAGFGVSTGLAAGLGVSTGLETGLGSSFGAVKLAVSRGASTVSAAFSALGTSCSAGATSASGSVSAATSAASALDFFAFAGDAAEAAFFFLARQVHDIFSCYYILYHFSFSFLFAAPKVVIIVLYFILIYML